MSGKTFTTEETEALIALGVEAAKGHELELPPYPKKRLVDFVQGVVAGRIFTDRDVDPSVLSMVFMPLVFGALQPQGEALKALQDAATEPGEEPEEPEEPTEPKLPPQPKEPTEPDIIQPDQEKVRQIQSAIEWTDSPPDAMDTYLAEVGRENEVRAAKYKTEVLKWEQATEEWGRTCEALVLNFDMKMDEYGAALASYEERRNVWENLTARASAVRQGFMQQYTSTLGCIWEDIGEAGPRAINGYPMFMSMSMMNKDDFERARKAIERELVHQQEIEV